MSFFSSFARRIETGVKAASTAVADHVEKATKHSFVDTLKDKVSDATHAIEDKASGITNHIEDKLSGAVHHVGDKLSGAVHTVDHKLSGAVHTVENKFSSGIHAVEDKIHIVDDKISAAKDSAFVQASKGVYNAVSEIRNGTETTFSVLDNILPKNSQVLSKTLNFVSNGVSDTQDFLQKSGINRTYSFLASIQKSILGGTTLSNLDYLNDKIAIKAPVDQDLSKTPTVSQFLNASNAEYTIGGVPDGLTPFLVNGKQLYTVDSATGMSSRVWLTGDNQVIISFQGTGGGDNAALDPVAVLGGVASDAQVWNQQTSGAEKSALAWTNKVVQEAEARGISTNNIFVTGHSLGGIEASYVAQQTGLGGVAFSSTGIPDSSTAVGDGSNFASIVVKGDPVGNYGTDTNPGSSFVTWKEPGASGNLNHYGKVIEIGSDADSEALKNKVSTWQNGNILDKGVTVLSLANDFLKYHSPSTLAGDLGVTLTTHSLSGTVLPDAIHGTPLNAGNDTIGQLMSNGSSVLASQQQNSIAA